MKILFTKALHHFLIQHGYTHIQLRGIERKGEEDIPSPALPNDDFILIPWKKGIGSFEEAVRIEKIDSTEITDMLGVEFGIRFWVELPEEMANLFEQNTKTN